MNQSDSISIRFHRFNTKEINTNHNIDEFKMLKQLVLSKCTWHSSSKACQDQVDKLHGIVLYSFQTNRTLEYSHAYFTFTTMKVKLI